MRVTVEIVGEDTHEVELDESGTYGDLLEPFEYSRHEVSIVVDGQPVPEDQPVEVDRVQVLRLVQGG
ncbi:MAG: ubiquitin-like small modifier protein SAMP2 [Halapricum sp.]